MCENSLLATAGSNVEFSIYAFGACELGWVRRVWLIVLRLRGEHVFQQLL
jgi:hypothetical protein